MINIDTKLNSTKNNNFIELMNSQFFNPLEEIKLSKSIKKIGCINNQVSMKVKSQYEENPYPRWKYSYSFYDSKINSFQVINSEINPNSIESKSNLNEPNILIAGCGTGSQVFQAQKYNNAEIVAIDLSSSSLSYTQRKLNESEIENVKLIQMDILDSNLLNQKFDIIECSGVLHHMSKPGKGLEILTSLLNNHGYLKLGLYSELARKDIIKFREYVNKYNIKSNKEGILNFRQEIIRNSIPDLNFVKTIPNFYSCSELRDLCFHKQEHRYNIDQIEEILKSNNLQFLGFILPYEVKLKYQIHFPEDKRQLKLKNWKIFEEKFPTTFRGMYQFWTKIS